MPGNLRRFFSELQLFVIAILMAEAKTREFLCYNKLMRLIADFHIHSKYSRATSKDMDLEHLTLWAGYKGIDLLGTGDFTHPFWFAELEKKLEEVTPGVYELRKEFQGTSWQIRKIKFILTAEVSSIYSQGGKVRKIHTLIFAPSMEAAGKLNHRLEGIGNLYSDGRPILGLSARDLAKIAFDIDENFLVVPAHAWTPWFSIFGSMSGFDSIEECFGELAPKIYAIETGLSSDPEMNWRLSKLDNIALISNSDSHSPQKIGREANFFEIKDDAALNYSLIAEIIRDSSPRKRQELKPIENSLDRMLYTIEFFPEEGKYHFDGHRFCQISFSPEESKKNNNLCPKCKKSLTIGVLNRVQSLADRPKEEKPDGAVPSFHLVPLDEIIAEALGIGKQSKAVLSSYLDLINHFGSEFSILLDKNYEELEEGGCPAKIIEGIRAVREGKVKKTPGFDGEYGIISVFGKSQLPELKTLEPKENNQLSLL